MRISVKVAGGIAALVVLGSLVPDDEPPRSVPTAEAGTSRTTEAAADLRSGSDVSVPEAEPTAGPSDEPAPVPTSTPPPTSVAAAALLQAASGGDGDSWKDAAGKEYRLGLVNTPEADECYGAAATARRKELTAAGFRAEVYTVDRYRRSVSVVTTVDGRNLNVYLARYGFANDRYLEQFRAENRSLAADLDVAFAAAKAERAGLWGACADPATTSGVAAAGPARRSAAAAPVAPAAVPAAQSGCHPDYLPCIPVQGTGSGSGAANDLDCGDIRKTVTVRQVGVDPYRLDGNDDGTGCESYA